MESTTYCSQTSILRVDNFFVVLSLKCLKGLAPEGAGLFGEEASIVDCEGGKCAVFYVPVSHNSV